MSYWYFRRKENQTGIRLIYCTRSLKTMVIRYLHYIGGKNAYDPKKPYPVKIPLTDQEKRKASSPKQAFRNYATHTPRKLLQNVIKCFLAPIKIIKVSFFQSPTLPELQLATEMWPNPRKISYMTSPRNDFKKNRF